MKFRVSVPACVCFTVEAKDEDDALTVAHQATAGFEEGFCVDVGEDSRAYFTDDLAEAIEVVNSWNEEGVSRLGAAPRGWDSIEA